MRILFIFLYVAVLYAGLAAAVMTAIYWARNKHRRIFPLTLVALAIIADLLIFDTLLYNKVIFKRTNIKFNERPTSYEFSPKRATNMIADDLFHNFRPSLYKKPVAISSYTLNEDFFHKSALVRLYVIMQNHSDKYPLYDEFNTLSIREFIKYGFSNIDRWEAKERRFFSYVLQSVIEGAHINKNLYRDYIDIGSITKILSDDVVRGEAFFTLHSTEWPQRDEVEKTVLSLFDFPEEPHFYYENGDYALLERYRRPMESMIRERKFYAYIFNSIPAREYLGYLFERSVMREHSFVLLADYYQLLNSNREYPDLREHSIFISNKLLAAMGVTEPIIRYYPSAVFSDRNSMLRIFGGYDTDPDILYLEGRVDKANAQPGKGFSYDISGYGPNTLSLKYNAQGEGYLYFSDSYDTYWNAYIDGKKTDIYKANVAFKAIRIPSGSHDVRFVYDPKYFAISLWIYYIAFAACAAYLVIGALTKANKTR